MSKGVESLDALLNDLEGIMSSSPVKPVSTSATTQRASGPVSASASGPQSSCASSSLPMGSADVQRMVPRPPATDKSATVISMTR